MQSLAKLKQQNLPAIKAYKLKKIYNSLEEQYKTIIETRNDLIKKHWKQEWEQLYIPTDDSEWIQDFSKEFNEVLEDEIEYNFDKIELNENDLESVKLSVEDISNLENFITVNI